MLPLVSQMNKVTLPTTPDVLSHGVHVANLETDHPYPQAAVLHYKVGVQRGVCCTTAMCVSVLFEASRTVPLCVV